MDKWQYSIHRDSDDGQEKPDRMTERRIEIKGRKAIVGMDRLMNMDRCRSAWIACLSLIYTFVL